MVFREWKACVLRALGKQIEGALVNTPNLRNDVQNDAVDTPYGADDHSYIRCQGDNILSRERYMEQRCSNHND